jgi:hypothetical protein
LIAKPTPGLDVTGLTLHNGDQADWYIIPAPAASHRLGVSQTAQLTRDMIDVRFEDPTADALFHLPANVGVNYFLYAASAADPSQPLSLTPVERFDGVPQYYLLRIVNLAGVVPQGKYTLHFHGAADAAPRVGDTLHIPASGASFTVDAGDTSFQPVSVALGDINGDGYDDFIAAVRDSTGQFLDQQFANGRHPAMLLAPSDARGFWGAGALGLCPGFDGPDPSPPRAASVCLGLESAIRPRSRRFQPRRLCRYCRSGLHRHGQPELCDLR